MHTEGIRSDGIQGSASGGLPSEVRLRLHTPADVVAAVPYLLGFHPRDSLVLVSIGGGQVSLASRIDLPPPEHVAAATRQLATIMADQHCDEVLIVLVGGVGGAGGHVGGAGGQVDRERPARRDLVSAMRAAFASLGIPVSAAVWVPEVTAGVTWRCYDSDGCGILADPATSAVAAATVAAGHVTYPDREHLERLVAPTDPVAVERRSHLLNAHCDRHGDQLEDPDEAADAFSLLNGWIKRAGSECLALGDDDVVALCLALSDPMLRDAAFSLAEGPRAAAAERLWTTLVRESPDPEAAEPAVLLAYSALVRGNGALVGIALERAQRAWPGHRMSELFLAALDGGMGPEVLRGWFSEGAAQARMLLSRRGVR